MGVWRRLGLIVVLALGLAAGGAHATGAADSGQRPDPALRRALERALEGSDSFANRFDAEVWLMDMSTRLRRRIPDPNKRLRLLKLVHYEARRADLEPEWVLALIDVESDFRRFAISSAGARGYMQIMPFWLDELDRPDGNLFRPALNLRMGCTILRHYLNIENGNLTRALARYNGSLGQTWYPERVFRALRRRWHPQ
ncbi:lytic transglycosylase domain-containing protein [Arhodomonas aquaeolei]|uniref:lytic transglycosylase domain-containing protein n=1 Tax=Arhodomonas aquaeolei TaxID=2369 RepID=UPI00037F8757|nr:lytic transglycosylase domain-containing protein [Arhodomonas aquaeolei]